MDVLVADFGVVRNRHQILCWVEGYVLPHIGCYIGCEAHCSIVVGGYHAISRVAWVVNIPKLAILAVVFDDDSV